MKDDSEAGECRESVTTVAGSYVCTRARGHTGYHAQGSVTWGSMAFNPATGAIEETPTVVGGTLRNARREHVAECSECAGGRYCDTGKRLGLAVATVATFAQIVRTCAAGAGKQLDTLRGLVTAEGIDPETLAVLTRAANIAKMIATGELRSTRAAQ